MDVLANVLAKINYKLLIIYFILIILLSIDEVKELINSKTTLEFKNIDVFNVIKH